MDEQSINLDDYIDKIDYYDIQINKTELVIKKIGCGDEIGEVVIEENFGLNNKCNLYHCVYKLEELEKNNIYSIVKLYYENRIYSIAVSIEEDIVIDKKINNFKMLFTTTLLDIKKIKYFDMDKIIDGDNIVEKLFDKLIDLNIMLL